MEKPVNSNDVSDSNVHGLELPESIEKRNWSLKKTQNIKVLFFAWLHFYLVAFLGLATAIHYFDVLHDQKMEHFIYVLFSGVMGVFFSICARIDRIEFPEESEGFTIHFQIINKFSVGLIVGLVICFLIESNLALGIAAGNTFAIHSFSFIGGFLERLNPDLMNES